MSQGAGAFGPYQRGEKFQVRVRAQPGGPAKYSTFETFNEAEEYRLAQARLLRPGTVFVRAGAKELRTHPDLRLVYFIQAETGGPIKIGSAVKVEERVTELQQGHPDRLVLLATAKGGEKRERAWHRQFSAARHRGEWFTPVPALIILIGELRASSSPATLV